MTVSCCGLSWSNFPGMVISSLFEKVILLRNIVIIVSWRYLSARVIYSPGTLHVLFFLEIGNIRLLLL